MPFVPLLFIIIAQLFVDKGFDAQGKQVWGAENESYQYRWITPQSP